MPVGEQEHDERVRDGTIADRKQTQTVLVLDDRVAAELTNRICALELAKAETDKDMKDLKVSLQANTELTSIVAHNTQFIVDIFTVASRTRKALTWLGLASSWFVKITGAAIVIYCLYKGKLPPIGD